LSGLRQTRVYRSLGVFFFALGSIGIGVPLLPTVIFWIIAAIFFAHSDPALRDRIYNHPKFGPTVRDYLEDGALSLRAKLFAVCGITGGTSVGLWLAQPPHYVIGLAAVLVVIVLIYLVTRPAPPVVSEELQLPRSQPVDDESLLDKHLK